MVILLVICLWLISLSMRITITGINSLAKVTQRKVNSEVEGEEIKKTVNTTTNLVKDTSTKILKVAKLIVDVLKNALTAILPVVLILDILVFILLTTIAGGTLLLFNDEGSVSSSITNSNSGNVSSSVGQKNKILLIGDSRTVQLGITVFGMSYTNDSDDLPKVVGSTSSGDYLYAKGSIGLSWMKQEESNIDKQVDGNTAVVVNMGTNDCFDSSSANDYITYLNNKAQDWESKGAVVYFVSVNPVNDGLAEANGYSIRDRNVVSFNNAVKNGVNSDIKYIDTYSEVKTLVINDNETGDGVHYNEVVYKKIKEVIWGVIKPVNT